MNSEIDKPKAGRRLAQGARLFTAVAVLLIGGEELFSRWTDIQYLEVFLEKRATLEILAWGALVAGSLGAILGLILLVRFGKARLVWGATGLLAMIVSGTVVVISHEAIPPRFTEADLNSWAEDDKPVVEEITGRHYKRPVTIRIGSREELLVLMDPWFRRHEEEASSYFSGGTTFAYLGVYEPKEHLVRLFPAAFAYIKKGRGLSRSACLSMARRTLLTELVHALDDQHGFFRPREDVEQLRESALQEFLVIRALEEGHAGWVADRVFEKLHLSFLDSERSGVSETNTLAWMMEGVVHFMYVEGKDFVDALHRAGGTALVEKTILNPPPWLHYVRYPDIYFADLESGDLTIYQKLADVLEKVPEEGQWVLTTRPAGPDITLIEIPWETASPEQVEVEEHRLAIWLAGYSEKTAPQRRMYVWLSRHTSPDWARRYATHKFNAYLESAKSRQSGASVKKISQHITQGSTKNGWGYSWISYQSSQPYRFYLYSAVKDWAIQVDVRVDETENIEKCRTVALEALNKLIVLRTGQPLPRQINP